MTLLIASTSNAKPLSTEEAFNLSVTVQKQHLDLQWQLAPKHYLYKEQLSLIDENNAKLLNDTILPKETIIQDPILGEYAVYADNFNIRLPWHTTTSETKLLLRFQGCAKDGFCYLPVTKLITITGTNVQIEDSTLQEFPPKFTANNLAEMLADRFLPLTLIIFFGLGILLSFTPCVLPMIPIVVNLIVGTRTISTRKAFILSSSYVFGMAVCYAIAGIIAGLLGATLQAWLQQPIILIGLSIFLVILALGQFEIIHVKLPHFNTRLHHWSQRQLQGSYIGAFILGILSALIVSPCITPPLIGALTYISQNGNPMVGGLALLCLGLGMGIPLIIVAMLSNMILPKAGEWMNYVKDFAGLALLALAIWLTQRIMPTYISIILWGALGIVAAFLFKAFKPVTHSKTSTKIFKTLGILLAIFGAAVILNSLYIQFFMPHAIYQEHELKWQNVDTLNELNLALDNAKAMQKYTLLDFSADWCTSCKRIEATVFTNKDVINALSNFVILKVDMTKMDQKQKTLLTEYKVYGPPVIIFFNKDGSEITSKRVEGEINASEMLNLLQTM